MKSQSLLTFSLLLGCLLFGEACQANITNVPTAPTETDRIALGDYPDIAAVNSTTGYTYIANGRGVVSVLEGNEVVATFNTLQSDPRAIAIDEARGWVYILNHSSNSVSVFQDEELIGIVALDGEWPTDITIDPETGWAYVITGYAKRASDHEAGTTDVKITALLGTKIMSSLDLGKVSLQHMIFDPIGDYLYVGGVSKDLVVFKDLQEVARFEVSLFEINLGVEAIDINPTTGDVFVLTHFSIMQFRNKELINNVILQTEQQGAVNLLVHPVTGYLYIGSTKPLEIIVMKSGDEGLNVIGRVPVASIPQAITADPLTGNVYVANYALRYGTNNVVVINGTEKLAELTDMGGYIYGMGVNAKTGQVYIPDGYDSVSILGFDE